MLRESDWTIDSYAINEKLKTISYLRLNAEWKSFTVKHGT